MQCVECEGAGCEACGGRGEIEIAHCPLGELDMETRRFIDLARLYLDYGLPPVAGGSLDQTACFIDGAAFVAGEIGYWKRQLGIIDG